MSCTSGTIKFTGNPMRLSGLSLYERKGTGGFGLNGSGAVFTKFHLQTNYIMHLTKTTYFS